MLLEILGTLERLATELALVGLEGNMDADVGGDVITLDRGSTARVPLASEVQVVGALATDMALTNVLLEAALSAYYVICDDTSRRSTYIERLRCGELLVAGVPAAHEVVLGGSSSRRGGRGAGGRRRRRLGVGVAVVAGP